MSVFERNATGSDKADAKEELVEWLHWLTMYHIFTQKGMEPSAKRALLRMAEAQNNINAITKQVAANVKE